VSAELTGLVRGEPLMMPMTTMFVATAAFTMRSTLVRSNWFWTGSAPANGTASHRQSSVGSQVCRDLEESRDTGLVAGITLKSVAARRRHELVTISTNYANPW
jgi:hypothetical protein